MDDLTTVLSFVLAFGVTTSLAGCGSNLPYTISNPATHAPIVTEQLTGVFPTTEGATVDLSAANDKPTVIVFSQDSCLVCAHEADSLRDALTPGTGASGAPAAGVPTNVHLYTVLVGAILEDAVDWKHDHRVPWTVGIDTDASLFTKYCTQRTVPCNVVYLPGKGVVLRKHGASERAELESLTGQWEVSP